MGGAARRRRARAPAASSHPALPGVLDCLRHRLPPENTCRCGRTRDRARHRRGPGADHGAGHQRGRLPRVALAASLRIAYEPLDGPRGASAYRRSASSTRTRADCCRSTAKTGSFAIAPNGLAARWPATGAHPLPPGRFRLTSARRLRSFVLRHGQDAWRARGLMACASRIPTGFPGACALSACASMASSRSPSTAAILFPRAAALARLGTADYDVPRPDRAASHRRDDEVIM